MIKPAFVILPATYSVPLKLITPSTVVFPPSGVVTATTEFVISDKNSLTPDVLIVPTFVIAFLLAPFNASNLTLVKFNVPAL